MLLFLFQGSGGWQYREELILNVTVFVVRVCGEQYREKLILNVTVFLLGSGRRLYRKKLILNVLCLF